MTPISARDMGLVACRTCGQPHPLGTAKCQRCGRRLQSRDGTSLQRVWAYWLAGLMCYIPANMYPMLETRTLLSVQDETIIGGAVSLLQYGEWLIAVVIVLASIAIPIGKFLAIAFLARSVARPSAMSTHHRQMLYEVVEYIGRWSMVDVFVVAILSSLVQLNALATITPGIASLFFALSVIFTMLSAQAFDSRLIWDAQSERDRLRT